MKTLLLLVVLVAACSSKGDESKSSGSSAGGPGSGAGQAQTPEPKGALDSPASPSTAVPAGKAACKLTGSCSRCKDSKDCTGGETCITYQKGANHYSGCVDGRTCTVGQIMMQGDTLCGTKNKMD